MSEEAQLRSSTVTVVMIFFNGEEFIEAAISSVFSQTYPAWELLLVDDGSTDRSGDIARRYAASYPGKVRHLKHPQGENRGMSASRNLGLREGIGGYVAFLDCDDVWHAEKLQRQVRVLTQNPKVDLVYNATWCWYSWQEGDEHRRRDHARPLGIQPERVVPPPGMIPLFLLDRGQTPATCSVLIRRSVFESVGGFEEGFRGLYEDQVFFYKVFLNHIAYIMDGHWDFYRQHTRSCCYLASAGAGLTVYHPAHGRFLAWFRSFLAQQPVSHPEISGALNEACRPFDFPVLFRIERMTQAAWTFVRNVASGDRRRRNSALTGVRGYFILARRRAVGRVLPPAVHQRLRAIRDAIFH